LETRIPFPPNEVEIPDLLNVIRNGPIFFDLRNDRDIE
jgi:hypothetical protein